MRLPFLCLYSILVASQVPFIGGITVQFQVWGFVGLINM